MPRCDVDSRWTAKSKLIACHSYNHLAALIPSCFWPVETYKMNCHVFREDEANCPESFLNSCSKLGSHKDSSY